MPTGPTKLDTNAQKERYRMAMVRQKRQLVHPRGIDDQITLQCDWASCITGHIQPKMVVSDPTFPWWWSSYKILKMFSDFFQWYCWSKNVVGQNQPKVIVLDATFPSWLSLCTKSEISINFLQWYCWSKNPAIWLDERQVVM